MTSALIKLLEGIVVGFCLAAPIGPVGVLCLRRSLAHGGRHGFFVGLSGALADVVYAVIAAFGITLVSDFVTREQHLIRFVGGLLLLAMGFYVFRSRPSTNAPVQGLHRHAGVFLSTFLLALTNPLTLFAYLTMLSAIGARKSGIDHLTLALLVVGVFLGSLLWFSLLIGLARIFKEQVTISGLSVINKTSGSLLMVFGVLAVWSGLRGS